MKIGIDLDGVIFDTESQFRVAADIYDVEHFGLNNVIDSKQIRFQDRYNWDAESVEDFYSKNVFDLEENSPFMPGVKYVLKYLKERGHKLYIISARGFYSQKQIDITMKRLKENDLDIFEEYIFKADRKIDIIEDRKIDLMIDDNIDLCKSISDICEVLYFKDGLTYDINKDNVTTVYNWGDVYRFFKEKEGR